MTITCSIKGCEYSFHAECGRRGKLYYQKLEGNFWKCKAFCPSHTPLLIKKSIEREENRTREDIIKFLKNIKRFLK